MSVTYGFYNSLNGDRTYDAEQFSSMFDGLIEDGVFASIGSRFAVSPADGMAVYVADGKAWFNHTWTINDSVLVLDIPASEVLLNRIDAIVLEVDATSTARQNSIKVVSGTPASSPENPELTNTDTIHQYALAYIAIAPGSTSITGDNITNMVGTSETPLVTGILGSSITDSGIAICPDGLSWTLDSSGLYKVTVSINGFTATKRAYITPIISTSDTSTGDAQRTAWLTHYYAETVLGGIRFWAKNLPAVSVTFAWEIVG